MDVVCQCAFEKYLLYFFRVTEALVSYEGFHRSNKIWGKDMILMKSQADTGI